jgi:long-chain fatty acid transport protein
MMRTRYISLSASAAVLALALTSASPAQAAGFLVYDASGEAMGKASAHSAGVSEPSAVLFNPAAMAYMPGYQVSAGAVFVTAAAEFEPAGGGSTTKALDQHFFLPTIYGTARVNRWLAVGLGVYTIFGLGIKWPEDWVGREHSIEASIETVTFSPSVAFRLHDRVSLAVGLNVVRGVVDMTNGLPEAVGGTVRIGGATFGFGAHAAVLWRIFPNKLHFAVTYHSRAKLSFDGKADFEPEAEEFEPELEDQGGKADITLPDILTFGLEYRPLPELAISFDTNVVFWETYDELVLDFEKREDQVLLRRNRTVATFRLGFDYEFLEGLHGRLGFIFDMNPAPKKYLSPSLPDADRFDVAFGLGYEWKWLKVDAAYLLVYFFPSESVGGTEGPVGEYRSLAHLAALTVTGRFAMQRFAESPEGRILEPIRSRRTQRRNIDPPPGPAADPAATTPATRRAARPAPPVEPAPEAAPRGTPPPTKRPVAPASPPRNDADADADADADTGAASDASAPAGARDPASPPAHRDPPRSPTPTHP